MRNVKNVHYLQIDHRVQNILKIKGVEILPAKLSWEKYNWLRPYFFKKPKEGYFIWVKKQVGFPLFTCISISSKNLRQNLQNLLIIEKNLKVNLKGVCNSQRKDLNCGHKARGKIILKEGSSLKYSHIHSWSEKDIVEPDYEFLLEKNSELDYTYKNLFSPKNLKIKTDFNLLAGAAANIKIIADCRQTQTEIKDTLRLKGKGSSGQIQLRLVGRKNSQIEAKSLIVADSAGKGHLDCQGLLIDKDSIISLDPKLVCKNKLAQLTHEASIGKISEEELNYLRMRGLTESEAVNLIVNGFLGRDRDEQNSTT